MGIASQFRRLWVNNWLVTLLVAILNCGVTESGDTCDYAAGHQTRQVYCEYGCCGTYEDRECCSYTISTSVLIVAGIVGGLVIVALIAAFIICCVKNYQDKRRNRVRNLRQTDTQQQYNLPRRAPATMPKPPEYTEAPPPYSVNMPTSHFRPPTVNGNYNYNTRFQRTQPRAPPTATTIPEGSAALQTSAISHTRASGVHPAGSGQQSTYPPNTAQQQNVYPPTSRQESVNPPTTGSNRPNRGSTTETAASEGTRHYAPPPTPVNPGIPGSTFSEPPPAYSEFARGQTPRVPTSQIGSV